MKGSRKDRRSKRVPAAHRLLLTIEGGTGTEIAKEIVSTVELSQFGARVRGRRVLRPESEGMLTQLSSGRQARVRIAWQEKATAQPGFLDSGVEILSGFDYWGISFAESGPSAETAVAQDAHGPAAASQGAPLTAAPLTIDALLHELKEQSAAGTNSHVLESIWCGLIDQLEARQVLSRAELIAAVRSIAHTKPARKSVSTLKK